MFRILKFVLFIALLGAAYGFYHLNAAKQRDQEALAWSNRLIWDVLGADSTSRFGGQSIAQGPTDKSWRVTGRIAAKTPEGAPIEGDYQAVVVQHCATVEDERCWGLQALKVGDSVIVAGAGLEAQPAPQPKAQSAPAQPQVAAKAPAVQADSSDAGAAPVAGGGASPPPGPAEKAVVFALPPPDLADSSLGFSAIEAADGARPVRSAIEAAAQVAMQASPKSAAVPAPQAAAPLAQGDSNDLPEQEIQPVPVAPVQLAAELEASMAPAAGEPSTPPAAKEQVAALPQQEAATAEAARFDPLLLRDTQDRLIRLEYGRGALTRSGAYDSATEAAIMAYQVKNGLPADGQPSRALLVHMDRFLARLDAIASGQAAPKPATSQAAYATPSSPATVIGGYASFRKGLEAAGRGEIDEAIAHYTRAIESTQWRERHLAYLSRGKVLAGTGNYRQAINDYSTAIDLRPDYAEAWINRGLAFAELEQREQALADLRQGQRLAPGSSAAEQALRTLESRSQLQ